MLKNLLVLVNSTCRKVKWKHQIYNRQVSVFTFTVLAKRKEKNTNSLIVLNGNDKSDDDSEI